MVRKTAIFLCPVSQSLIFRNALFIEHILYGFYCLFTGILFISSKGRVTAAVFFFTVLFPFFSNKELSAMGAFCNFIVVIHTVMNECKNKINHVSARVITENVWIKKGIIDTLFIKYAPSIKLTSKTL